MLILNVKVFIRIAICWQGLLEFFSIKFYENLFIISRVDGQRVTAEFVVVLQVVVKKQKKTKYWKAVWR